MIQVEPTFNSFVKAYGGKLISEIVSRSPGFKNADYLFDETKIIAELKCLQKDFFDKIIVDSNNIDEIVIKNSKTLYNVVRDANKQIRETKKNLKKEDYQGLLLLVNDGNYSFKFELLMDISKRVIADYQTRGRYESIDAMVIFTVNMPLYYKFEDSYLPSFPWFVTSKNDNYKDEVIRNFMKDIGNHWRIYFETLSGFKLMVKEAIDKETFKNLDYLSE